MGIIERISQFVPKDNICENELMSRHTTFKVGGPCSVLVKISEVEQLKKLLPYLVKENIPYFFLGNGSNILVSDKGFDGVVITYSQTLAEDVEAEGDKIIAGGGVLLSKVAKKALDASLTGFEFAAGIPGTVGGAMVMNAGAYGGEMKDVVSAVTVLTKDGEIKTLTGDEMNFRYRGSVVEDEGYIVLEAVMELKEGNLEEIQARIEELSIQRKTKQPIEYPSAGSTFKRPEGYFAGKLIQDSGLRGYKVGGAQVSEKHCGFVINAGGATAADVMQLMQDVSDKVNAQFGVTLEPEVKRIGEF